MIRSLVVLAALGAPLSAQIVPTGPFTGTDQEGFESQSSGSGACLNGRLFNGQADLCGLSGSSPLISSSWGFNCSMKPRTGGRFTASSTGAVEYLFDTPISRFGGYFGSNSPGANATIDFYDAAGALLGSLAATFANDCNWYWQGWDIQVGNGASRIVVTGGYSSGGFVDMDDMEADFTPPYTLVGAPDQISLSGGGSQVLSLDLDDAHGGKTYIVVGSASGVTPGIPYGGGLIPLNFDAYMNYVFLNPNTPLLNGSAGTLNSLAQATTVFTLPPLSDPSLAGLVVNHAGFVIELVSGSFQLPQVSNPYPVTLVP